MRVSSQLLLGCPNIFAVLFVLVSSSFGIEAKARKVDTSFPTDTLQKLGSGSGVIIGNRYILTNRHVATEDNGNPYKGFRVRFGRGHTESVVARCAWICDEYDLAILELKSDVAFNDLFVLSELPPLGTRITAFGFPRGDEFGVGLTSTGGQITRLPVDATSKEKDESGLGTIKRSMWYDATIAKGSSGGPLFGENNVLIGLIYGALASDNRFGLAVPSDAIANFLKSSGAIEQIRFITADELATSKGAYDPNLITVFIEILGDAKNTAAKTTRSTHSIQEAIVTEVQKALPRLSVAELESIKQGDLKPAFPASPALKIKPGDVVRLSGKMNVIQFLEKGMLAEMDGVLCRVINPEFNESEVRAKVGSSPILDVPFDNVFVVGDAEDYTTVTGRTNSYFPLIVASSIVDIKKCAELATKEFERRADAKRVSEKESREKALKLARTTLRRTLTDSTGKYTIEALILDVDINKNVVKLYRLSDKKLLEIGLDKLSAGDREWIRPKVAMIRHFGQLLKDELATD